MTPQSLLRQTFARDWERLAPPGPTAWLIKGDFDHFRRTNDLYGALLADYLLDWTLEVIEAELQRHQQQWGGAPCLLSVTGDDLTIYVPPAARSGEDIARLLGAVRAAVADSFTGRYRVGALPLPSTFFDELAPAVLEQMRDALEALDVVLDFAPRQRGFLLLFPAGAGGSSERALERVARVLRRGAGCAFALPDLRFDWLCDPGTPGGATFKGGILHPPSVSFAAWPFPRQGGSLPADPGAVYEQVSCACQSALKTCKQQRLGLLVGQAGCDLPEPPGSQPAWNCPLDTPLRWSSERYLREKRCFHRFDRPVLFQFNPVYRLAEPVSAVPRQVEQYRGNHYGIGLKGINEIYGQPAADRVIGQLISIFSKVIQAALVAKGVPPERVFLAQFVDRFTVLCEQPIFDRAEIIALVRALAGLFNAASADIQITHLRASLVLGQRCLPGYRLFHQLALTSLAPQPTALIEASPPVEVRENTGPEALEAGQIALERAAFESALALSQAEVDPERA